MKFDGEGYALENIPQCGAIFMASLFTKKECLTRRVLALPSSKANFVKQIKTGMLLFLFEYDKRQLYGVFQATTNGAMDIVPDAFHYPGMHFPAQVRFKPVWNCHPLDEKDFRGSIRENYFTPKKFKLGLTEVQVNKLLCLFSSRKIQKLPPRVPKVVTDKVCTSGKSELREVVDKKDNDHKPSSLSDVRMASPTRPNKDRLNRHDVVNGDCSLSKRRRLDCDEVLLMNDEAEYEKYSDHGIRGPTCTDSLVDTPLEVRRPVDNQQSCISGKIYDENEREHMLNHAIGKYPVGPGESRVRQFDQGDKLSNRSNLDHGFDLSNQSHANDDNTFLNGDIVHGEFNACDSVKPMVPNAHNSRILGQGMSRSGNHRHLMNEKMENIFDNVPASSSEWLSNVLHESGTTAGSMLPNTSGMESPYKFVNSVIDSSSENFLRQLDHERTFHERKLHFAEGRITDNTLDSIPCPATSRKDVYISFTDVGSVSDGSFRNSDRVEEAHHSFVGPAMSKYSSSFSNRKQLVSSSYDNPLSETGISSFSVDSYDPSHPGYDDPTISSYPPYIPELPYATQGCSASATFDNNCSSGQETHPYLGSLRNSYSLSSGSSLPSSLSLKSNRSMDVDLAGGIKSSPTNISTHQSPVLSRRFSPSRPPTIQKDIDGGKTPYAYPSKSTENSFGSSDHPKMASRYVPDSDSKDLDCSKDFVKGSHHPARDISSYGDQCLRTSGDDNMIEDHKISEAPQSGPNTSRRSVFTRLTPCQDVQASEHGNDAQFDSDDQYMDASADEVMEMLYQCNNLSLRKLKDSKLGVQSKHYNADLDKNQIRSHIDLSHSTVKDKNQIRSHIDLRHSTVKDTNQIRSHIDLSHSTVKDKNQIRSHIDLSHSTVKDKNQIRSHIDLSHSTVKDKNLEDSYLGITKPESTGDVPEEMRTVDFKRRSLKKKSLTGTNTDLVTDTDITFPEYQVERPTKGTLKRKRLIRPVFEKIEPANEVTSSHRHDCEESICIHKDGAQTDNASLRK